MGFQQRLEEQRQCNHRIGASVGVVLGQRSHTPPDHSTKETGHCACRKTTYDTRALECGVVCSAGVHACAVHSQAPSSAGGLAAQHGEGIEDR